VPPVETVPAERPVEPELQRIVLPASSVIGLEIETTISSEKAEVEDRVNARVTRDVYADGRLAIPAGSRVLGNVTLVERGGKVKERARLGVRFHTLVIADGRQVPLRTETIYRDGEPPANDSSRKIGGAAVGGAVLGAILGGGKGAIAGATVGAGAGTAAVMAGGRKPATLTSGSVVTVKLASPVTFEVER
jgi:type IV secretory pathway VirB10-like protein